MANINYVRVGGVEVINTERLAAYLDHGLAPLGTAFDIDTCDGLAAAVEGEAFVPYRTPVQDEPPWFDREDPDTWDFAGLLPLDITGLDDSTRTVAVADTLSRIGIPGRPIRGPRTMGVTATLIGRTSESVYAGLAWLQRVLYGGCDADESRCSSSAELSFFTVCPTPVAPTADLDVPVTVTMPSPSDPGASPDAWVATGGFFTEPVETDDPDVIGTVFYPYSIEPLTYDGGSSLTNASTVIDGGPSLDVLPIISGGDSGPVRGDGTVAGFEQSCNPGPIEVQWYLRADPQHDAVMVIVDDSGAVIETGPTIFVTDAWEVYTWELPLGVDAAAWRPAIITSEVTEVGAVTIDSFALVSPEMCVDPYERTLPATVVTSGPTVTEVIDTGCGVILNVEWIWVALSPYRYGVNNTAITGLSWGDPPTFVAQGVTYDEGGGTAIPATPWNCAPPATESSCAIDPAAPTYGTPPVPPSIPDTGHVTITTQNVRSVWVNLGPEVTPANEGVLTVTLAAERDAVVGARVRVYDTADASGDVPDLCDFVYEYLIDYVPEDGVLTIDGTLDTFTTVCGAVSGPQDASAGVRGSYGGPTVSPVLRCDRRYLVLVQWLDVFPRTAPGFYTTGESQGDLTVGVGISIREG